MQSLFSPLVKRLGYEARKDESADTRQLRILAISAAAAAQDIGFVASPFSDLQHVHRSSDSVIAELKSRFANVKSIPADLERVVFMTASPSFGPLPSP